MTAPPGAAPSPSACTGVPTPGDPHFPWRCLDPIRRPRARPSTEVLGGLADLPVAVFEGGGEGRVDLGAVERGEGEDRATADRGFVGAAGENRVAAPIVGNGTECGDRDLAGQRVGVFRSDTNEREHGGVTDQRLPAFTQGPRRGFDDLEFVIEEEGELHPHRGFRRRLDAVDDGDREFGRPGPHRGRFVRSAPGPEVRGEATAAGQRPEGRDADEGRGIGGRGDRVGGIRRRIVADHGDRGRAFGGVRRCHAPTVPAHPVRRAGGVGPAFYSRGRISPIPRPQMVMLTQRTPLRLRARAAAAFAAVALVTTGAVALAPGTAPAATDGSSASSHSRVYRPNLPKLTQPVDTPADPNAPVPVTEIAHLQIPKIGLDAGVFEGIELSVINHGPSHWPGSAPPGGFGNMVLAGHRVTHSAPFRHVDRLVPGDVITVSDARGIYTYVVTGHSVVTPEQTEIAIQDPGYRMTLFACHPPGSAEYRYVVNAQLVRTEPPAPLA